MHDYLNLLRHVRDYGIRTKNRTGVDTFMIPGAHLRFDVSKGFPAVTTKKLQFKAVVGELLGFLRGYDSAADFRKLGCNVWDKNANEDGVQPNPWLTNPNRKGIDDLGRIYGVQWRKWRGNLVVRHEYPNDQTLVPASFNGGIFTPEYGDKLEYEEIDQLQNVLDEITNNPTSRRIIMHAWNPNELDLMSLPPCHVMYQFLANPETKQLHMCMYQRSDERLH